MSSKVSNDVTANFGPNIRGGAGLFAILSRYALMSRTGGIIAFCSSSILTKEPIRGRMGLLTCTSNVSSSCTDVTSNICAVGGIGANRCCNIRVCSTSSMTRCAKNSIVGGVGFGRVPTFR